MTNPANDPGPSLRIERLRTEYLQNPIGLDEPAPRFSWRLHPAAGFETRRGLAQSAYQIRVAYSPADLHAGVAALWDSQKVESGENAFIEYAGPPLKARQRAWWTVRVWDARGQAGEFAPPAFWEAGLLARDQWQAQWIGSHLVGGPMTEVPVPFFRKSFALPPGKTITSARLYATALGVYDFRLNGQRVGDWCLAPFWTNYHKRVQYQAYDVTFLLRPGDQNVIGAMLGDGWYCGYIGSTRRRQLWGDRPRLLGQLHVDFTDGSSMVVGTDRSWTTAAGPILSSDFFMGETYDARLEMPGWDAPGFAPGEQWIPATVFDDPGIAIGGMIGPPVRAIQKVRPVAILNGGLTPGITARGPALIVDMGQNMVGRVRLRARGKAGQTISMQFVEVLDEKGRPYTANLRLARQTDCYTLRGDACETFEPRFTFHGFRYVVIHGYPELTLDDLTGIVLHSDIEPTGSFECSDPLVNQLQHNIEWGQRGNFLDVPTDCPQRDERLGWTGDAQVFTRTAAFNFAVDGFFAKWMQDLRDSQSPDGDYPSYAPTNEGGTQPVLGRDGGPGWADAGIICPWTIYLCYADRRLIERHYPSMVKFLDHLESLARPFGMIRAHPGGKGRRGYGDWLSQDAKGVEGRTPKDLIGTAFLAHSARLLAQMAGILQKSDDAARFTRLADDTTQAFRRRFVTADGLVVGHTQTAYVLALHFDLLPESLRPAAVDALVQDIRQHGTKLTTGFLGTPYLTHVLTRGGRADIAYELLMQKNWPSWLYAPAHGATTIWERWDGWTHDRGFQDPGMNSFNHYAYGAIGDWLYQCVAGIEIDPESPGYRHVILHPLITANGPLTRAAAHIQTVHGRIASEWKIEGDRLRYKVQLPPGVSATVYLPAASGEIGESGKPVEQAVGITRAKAGPEGWELVSGSYVFEMVMSVIAK